LVLLHGGPGTTHEYFLPYVLPLAKHRQLVLIDERAVAARSGLTITLNTISPRWRAISKRYVSPWISQDRSAGALLRRHSRPGGGNSLSGWHSSVDSRGYRIFSARLNADFALIKNSADEQVRARIEALEARGIIGADGAQLAEYRKLADQAHAPYSYSYGSRRGIALNHPWLGCPKPNVGQRAIFTSTAT